MSDILLHRVGFTTEEEEFYIARARIDDMIDGILLETGASEYRIYLSDLAQNNFRYQIDPSYKANRTAPKPKHYQELKQYLIGGEGGWGALVAEGMEADDALGIGQRPDLANVNEIDTVICSIDKDLLQIPGYHYNFVRKEWTEVTLAEGLLAFYRSILTGDKTDNISGIFGIGPARAAKILPKWTNERDIVERIVSAYEKDVLEKKLDVGPEEVINTIRKNAQLLKIKQSLNEPLWDSEWLRPMGALKPSSTPRQEEVSNQSMEPTIQEIKNSDG